MKLDDELIVIFCIIYRFRGIEKFRGFLWEWRLCFCGVSFNEVKC